MYKIPRISIECQRYTYVRQSMHFRIAYLKKKKTKNKNVIL